MGAAPCQISIIGKISLVFQTVKWYNRGTIFFSENFWRKRVIIVCEEENC